MQFWHATHKNFAKNCTKWDVRSSLKQPNKKLLTKNYQKQWQEHVSKQQADSAVFLQKQTTTFLFCCKQKMMTGEGESRLIVESACGQNKNVGQM